MVKMRPRLQLLCTVEVRDAKGNVTFRGSKVCRSYVRAMADILYCQMSTLTVSVPDTGNTPRTCGQYVTAFQVTAAVGTTTWGIRVGTGTNAVAITDYALQTAIAEGSGAGQLRHSAMTFQSPITSGSSRQFSVIRNFTNSSGASITVQEVGLYSQGGAAGWAFCIERTLYTFTINNGATATVTYTLGVTV